MTNIRLLTNVSPIDIPTSLRMLADDIENGVYGPERNASAAVVLDTTSCLEVFFYGEGEPGSQAHLLLHSGAAKMMKRVTDAKG